MPAAVGWCGLCGAPVDELAPYQWRCRGVRGDIAHVNPPMFNSEAEALARIAEADAEAAGGQMEVARVESESRSRIHEAIGQAREDLGRALYCNEQGEAQAAFGLLAAALRHVCEACLDLAAKADKQ